MKLTRSEKRMDQMLFDRAFMVSKKNGELTHDFRLGPNRRKRFKKLQRKTLNYYKGASDRLKAIFFNISNAN